MLNSRVNRFLEENNILLENQAGFRKHYSTSDHIFSLNSIVEILKHYKNLFFFNFVDFSKAFDSVWRGGLWSKLLINKINGKFFRIVKHMFSNFKSCVSVNSDNSTFFSCNCGVRQGENLSPIFFSLYLNDLEKYLEESGNHVIELPSLENDLNSLVKIILMLYADDTILISDDPDKLQKCLNDFMTYCKIWKLNINTEKTKVVVFGSRLKSNRKISFK